MSTVNGRGRLLLILPVLFAARVHAFFLQRGSSGPAEQRVAHPLTPVAGLETSRPKKVFLSLLDSLDSVRQPAAPAPGPAAPGPAADPFAGYIGPWVDSFARPQEVGAGLTLKGKPGEDWTWEFGEANQPKFNEKTWAWEVPPPAPAAAKEKGKGKGKGKAKGKGKGKGKEKDVCKELLKAGAKDFPDQFLECHPYSYYSAGGALTARPTGCYCYAWSVNCPYETCNSRGAWDDECLAKPAADLGFTSISKMPQPLDGGWVPQGAFKYHPGRMSLCMYWQPKPPNEGLPPLDANFNDMLPVGTDLTFYGVTLEGCLKVTMDPALYEATKAALLKALGEKDITVIFAQCGSFKAMIEGPRDQVEKAKKKARRPRILL